MSIHINAPQGAIAPAVLLPGDPLRAKFIAENFLENPKCYNEVRGMLGFTGTYKGVPVSVQGTGMGQPSLSIYVNELFDSYGVQKAVRVGTCGGMQEDVLGGDIVIATGAVRMEGTSREFAPIEYPAVPDFGVTTALVDAARSLGIRHHVGVVQCKDSFFGQHEPEIMPVNYELENKWQAWLKMGCLASEMESAALFVAGQFLKVRCGSCFLVVANQERAKKGLENKQAHDTELAIKTAVEALRLLIKRDAGN